MTNGARNQKVVENRVSTRRFVNFVNQVERRTKKVNIESIKIAANNNIKIRVRNAARINNGNEEVTIELHKAALEAV